jgi:hypothetical protein
MIFLLCIRLNVCLFGIYVFIVLCGSIHNTDQIRKITEQIYFGDDYQHNSFISLTSFARTTQHRKPISETSQANSLVEM